MMCCRLCGRRVYPHNDFSCSPSLFAPDVASAWLLPLEDNRGRNARPRCTTMGSASALKRVHNALITCRRSGNQCLRSLPHQRPPTFTAFSLAGTSIYILSRLPSLTQAHYVVTDIMQAYKTFVVNGTDAATYLLLGPIPVSDIVAK